MKGSRGGPFLSGQSHALIGRSKLFAIASAPRDSSFALSVKSRLIPIDCRHTCSFAHEYALESRAGLNFRPGDTD